MKIYIAGPMTGIKDLNFPAFHAMADRLVALGHTPVNPAEINPDPTEAWEACMLQDLVALQHCDGIILLNGWEKSPGAQIERLWAIKTGKQLFDESVWPIYTEAPKENEWGWFALDDVGRIAHVPALVAKGKV